MRKGRYKFGTANPSSRLDEPMVRFIRESDRSGIELADLFKVTPAAISLVRTRKVWKHI